MRDLSIIEKQEHYQKLDELVQELNSEHRFLNDNGLKICHVCYMIPIDDIFLYYDYPFKLGKVEQFNLDLNNPNLSIYHNSNITLQCFRDNYRNGEAGFIFYKYQYDGKLNHYRLYNYDSNLQTKDIEILYNYLPIVHYASYLKDSYSAGVIYTPSIKNQDSLQLLTLYVPIKLVNDRISNTSLAVSIAIDNEKTFNRTLLCKVTKIVVTFLKSYFDSPVLEKILMDKRKSYILGYKHSIHSYFESIAFSNIVEKLQKGLIDKAIEIAERNITGAKTLELIHSFMFDYELFNSNYRDFNFMFKDKSIAEILNYFAKDVNPYTINPTINEEDVYKPQLQLDDGTYELFDLCLILWNLWSNACKSALSQDGLVEINLKFLRNKYEIKIKNSGQIPENYFQFINCNTDYPKKSDVGKPYRGLEIIRDIINNNRNFEFSAQNQCKCVVINLYIKK